MNIKQLHELLLERNAKPKKAKKAKKEAKK